MAFLKKRQLHFDRVNKRIAVSFPRPAGGTFSHFAHFISDFVLPFYSIIRRQQFLKEVVHEQVTLEVSDKFPFKFGPMMPLIREIFPGLQIEYTSRFSLRPVRIFRGPWHNNSEDLDHFANHLKGILTIKPSNYGVVVVRRGLVRDKYPGDNFLSKSGADRRAILGGLEKLLMRVMAKRRDTICVELETLSFSDQVSLFLNADTLIGQHGAAFVHSHWMPVGGHLIELQCYNRRLCPGMVYILGSLRNHKVSIVNYGCQVCDNVLGMNIGNATKVSHLLMNKKADAPIV